jgi:hypothetical protein
VIAAETRNNATIATRRARLTRGTVHEASAGGVSGCAADRRPHDPAHAFGEHPRGGAYPRGGAGAARTVTAIDITCTLC